MRPVPAGGYAVTAPYAVYSSFGVPGSGPEPQAIEQLARCLDHESAVAGALMADHHKGYSMPIGGVIAYRDMISPSGVGYDIGCGNCAMRTDLKVEDVIKDMPRIMDEVASQISFGVGRAPNRARHASHQN